MQVPCVRSPWSGTLDWRAFAPHEQVLARRVGDRDEWVIGVGSNRAFSGPFDLQPGTALFGALTFDLADELEGLAGRHPAAMNIFRAGWWEPDFFVRLRGREAELHAFSDQEPSARAFLERLLAPPPDPAPFAPITWVRRTNRTRYLEQLRRLMAHIQRGDVYEINYCTERTAQLPGFDPYAAMQRLMVRTDAPFAAFHRSGTRFALCASPERFLRIEGDAVITQPMKGTRRRSMDPVEDQRIAQELGQDAKERSENIMAVDVARHDLSRIAASCSVEVDELCGVRTYPNVHQLVSTVRARVRAGLGPADVLRATFPMASMTGAPKRRALQLIDEVEDMPRGLFSGSLGFFLPDGTADLNVVIRTITYDAATGHASLITGGAITAASDPEQEWEECELKARSVLQALDHAS